MVHHQAALGGRGRRALAALAVASVASLALGACGSTSTTTSPSTTTAASGTSGPAGTTATTATTGTTGTAPTGPVTVQVVKTPYGEAIGRGDGKALYTWDKEITAGNAAQCVQAACVDKWPPLVGTSVNATGGLDASRFTLVDRPDGTKQVAIDGRRLYAMSADEPGDANCQGVEGWWILKPDGTKNESRTAA